MFLAAIIHDYDHKGVNNDFLVKSQDDLAVRYNDRAPMENHHVASAWALLKLDSHDFMRRMPAKVGRRRLCITAEGPLHHSRGASASQLHTKYCSYS